ncbi:Hypp8203 [Branchiostoma lanceolatum]|uniref:Hypp8203 protein n=1 Tax=Branchiostoma lanceolatum TaxID=7740 RepID=A0A8J9Z7Z4_BRALA|nr:Hypp8203 [Branchiostoma lanceolatum]
MWSLFIIMVTVISCNFSRVAIYKSQFPTKEDGTEIIPDKKSRFSVFNAQFQGHKDFGIEYKSFSRSTDKIDNAFIQWAKFKRSQSQDDMDTYLNKFSPKTWRQLSRAEKETHQLQSEINGRKVQCKGCFVKYRALAETFNTLVSKDLTIRTFFKVNPLLNEKLNHKEQDFKAAGRQWYGHGNRTFQTRYGTSLASALVHVPEVQEAFGRQTPIRHDRKVATTVKGQQWQEDNIDVIVHQGTRESDSKYDERRLAMGFETRESAKKRTRERVAKEDEGRCRKKRRLGKSTEWGTWDWEAIRQEVTSWPDGKEVNWRAYALDKGVHNKKGEPAKNGGQMIRDWPIQEAVDIQRFRTAGMSDMKTPRPRRRKKRIPNTINVTMPTPRPAKEMRKSLEVMIENGDIPIGEMIVPKEFQKMVFNKENGSFEVKTFTVEGRKFPLD